MNFLKDEKYHMVGDVAFTEDNILIYNIFVRNLPKSASILHISKCFREFGEVLKVGFLGHGKGKGKNCFINFADPKVAAIVLQRKNFHFMNRFISVQPCKSWYQPNGQNTIQLLNGYSNDAKLLNEAACSNTSFSCEQNSLIFNLNDDCLEYICKMLTLNDQIHFALSCQRFCEIFKMISLHKYVNLNTELFATLTQFQSKVFLQIVGAQVKSLMIDFKYAFLKSHTEIISIIRFLGTFCTNVETLKIESNDLHVNKLRSLIAKMTQLKELHLNNVDVNVGLIKILQTLKNLKCLHILDDGSLNGKHLNMLVGLEMLSLSGCHQLNSFHFKKLCENLKNLQYLDIRSCDRLKKSDYEHILKYLINLETLKFSTIEENFNCLTKLPKLKQLEITDNEGIVIAEEFYKNLTQYQANNLEELKLQELCYFNEDIAALVAKLEKLKLLGIDNDAVDDKCLEKFSVLSELEELHLNGCDDISDQGVLALLEHSVQLKRLHLTFCDNITTDFVRNALKLLQEQHDRGNRTYPLHLTLTFKAQFEALTEENNIKSSDVLKITLDRDFKKLFNFFHDDDDDVYFDDDDDDFDYPFGYDYPFDYDYNSGNDDYYSDDEPNNDLLVIFRTKSIQRQFSHIRFIFLLIIVLNTLDTKDHTNRPQTLHRKHFERDLKYCQKCFEHQIHDCLNFFNLIETDKEFSLRQLINLLPERSCKRNNQLVQLKNSHEKLITKYLFNTKNLGKNKLKIKELKQKFFQQHEGLQGMQFAPLKSFEIFIKDFFLNDVHLNLTEITIWHYLINNIQPLLMPLLEQHNFPVPKTFKVCGFTLYQQYAGQDLYHYYQMEFPLKLEISKQLLQAALKFSYGFNNYRFYITDLTADNMWIHLRLNTNPPYINMSI
ncbi:uncharacterized protein LOC111688262 isoform X2 [Lucilia cuprina]|uniref:uncharacterized protein LOC111688262 isoform X2 n=1 Tax=Lucilia cuprina TaxID=7375 RepID=UPI001F062247|nr:uncharacterized protein LOC111688262 isoform X2 [Lucilia cuprina]